MFAALAVHLFDRDLDLDLFASLGALGQLALLGLG
jgi:hypothetical protein